MTWWEEQEERDVVRQGDAVKKAQDLINAAAECTTREQCQNTLIKALQQARNDALEEAAQIANSTLPYYNISYLTKDLTSCGCGPSISKDILALKEQK